MSQNARQIEGWAIDRRLPTMLGNKTFGFFEDRATAEEEAKRFNSILEPCRVVPATLILPALHPSVAE